MRKLVVAVAFLVAGCAGQVGAPGAPAAPADPAAALANFTIKDLQNASADAKAHSDKEAALCYDWLAGRLQAQASGPGTAVTGVVSAFQRVRDLQSTINAGVSQDFQLNCAPLLSDVKLNLAKLGLIGAGVAAGVTVAPGVLPVLP